MTASYTSNLRITKQGDNDNPNTWGQVTNNQVISLLEQAIASVSSVDVTGSIDVTLTATNGAVDQSRSAILEISGALGANINLIVPAVQKVYIIKATHTGGTVTVKPSGGSIGIAFTNGQNNIVYTNGTTITSIQGQALLIANNLSDLTNTTAARTNLGLTSLATATVGSGLDLTMGVLTSVAPSLITILTATYPVGSLYMNASASTNPATLFGFGTWTAFGAGRVLLGVGSGTDINSTTQAFTVGATGGEYTHTQTTGELATHKHQELYDGRELTNSASGGSEIALTGQARASQPEYTSNVGSSTPMPWLQPYITVYMWQRTA